MAALSLARVALARYVHEGGVNDLPFAREKAGPVEHGAKRVEDSRLLWFDLC